MKLNFLTKNKPAFGLDISGDSFKIMSLGKKANEVEVRAYSDVPLGKGVIINDEISDPKTFSYLLKQNMQKPQFGRMETDHVVVSLPESKSFVRVIQIPKMSEAEAENAVPYEAESFIPLPLDQVYLDWQIIGEKAGKLNILMIATPKVFVEKYLDVLDGAGLKTVALEVESQSCQRAVTVPDTAESFLLVDLDAFRSSLIMIEDGALQFTSTIPIAGNTFTEGIARALGIASVKAEQIKMKVGIANTVEYPNIKTSLEPILNNLSSEIKNILKFHSEHSEKQVTRLVLAGGSSKLKNLPEFLAPQLSDAGIIKVDLANPWLCLPQIKNPPLNPYDSLSFVTSIGLAARGLN